ncbi:hypothetical protein HPP92_028584 [Vanilla planifolia]|uniref:Uncharacterized protein n=1 Tax=Vanilla planifolia TaxID=51239 RepID=A0A835P7G1_VANPL|nr:hypothetical protein HPP92_028584 [Vanilla planifolia]
MKERQRWRSEEDAILRAYVKQYGAKVEPRLPADERPLQRDAKSCLERWKNYLKPGIKKGSLTEEEQRLVIRLQAKHGNKWKKIAAEVPGRTAKRLGKWWEVFKEKQQRESKENSKSSSDLIEPGKYDLILESFAEKLVKQRPLLMAAPLLPPWLATSKGTTSPSIAHGLSPSTLPTAPVPWVQMDTRLPYRGALGFADSQVTARPGDFCAEVFECCRELQEVHQTWTAHKKEASWRLKRVELQLESEKACKRREKIDEIESKVSELMQEQRLELERIDVEYRERLFGLTREAETEEHKLVEMWTAKHDRLSKFMEQMGCRH